MKGISLLRLLMAALVEFFAPVVYLFIVILVMGRMLSRMRRVIRSRNSLVCIHRQSSFGCIFPITHDFIQFKSVEEKVF